VCLIWRSSGIATAKRKRPCRSKCFWTCSNGFSNVGGNVQATHIDSIVALQIKLLILVRQRIPVHPTTLTTITISLVDTQEAYQPGSHDWTVQAASAPSPSPPSARFYFCKCTPALQTTTIEPLYFLWGIPLSAGNLVDGILNYDYNLCLI